MKRTLFSTLLASILLVAASAMVLQAQPFFAADPLAPPRTGVYLGIRANPDLAKPKNQEVSIEEREGPAPNGINRTFALHLHYYGWNVLSAELDSAGVFHPDTDLLGDISRGRVPVISWGCDSGSANTNTDHLIAGGDRGEDANITATAKALAQYPGPVMLRWFWEFNILENNQACRGDSGKPPTPQVYSDFIAAWQHIWRLFQKAGATNVTFLWNPGDYPFDGDKKDPHGFYPGNDFVNWIGVDTYQRSTTETFDDDFGLFYTDFSASEYGHKPMMVGENGSQSYAQNNSELQRTYFQRLLADVQANRYPLLKAYCYFDVVGQAGSWVLDDNNGKGNGGLAAFADIGASRAFSPTVVLPFSLFNAKAIVENGLVSHDPPVIGENGFKFEGQFSLGAGSNGIDPGRERVVLQIGDYFAEIPAGSFRRNEQNEGWNWREQRENLEYEFHGTRDGVELTVVIRYRGGNRFDVFAEGRNVNIGLITDPITLGVTIGDDGGGTTIMAGTGF